MRRGRLLKRKGGVMRKVALGTALVWMLAVVSFGAPASAAPINKEPFAVQSPSATTTPVKKERSSKPAVSRQNHISKTAKTTSAPKTTSPLKAAGSKPASKPAKQVAAEIAKRPTA